MSLPFWDSALREKMKIQLAYGIAKDMITTTVPFGRLRLLGYFDARHGVVRVSERSTLRLMEDRMLLTVALIRARLDDIVRAVLFCLSALVPSASGNQAMPVP
jgi:hypothetical protein